MNRTAPANWTVRSAAATALFLALVVLFGPAPVARAGGIAPTADAGGPYAIAEGGVFNPTGAASTDPESDTLSYAWDLDNDGQYDDATGVSPEISWASLVTIGLDDDGGPFTIGLEVDDGTSTSVDTAQMTIANSRPVITLSGAAIAAAGQPYAIDIDIADPGDDTVASWAINWGDGETETGSGEPGVVTHTYTQAGFSPGITAQITDEDGSWMTADVVVAFFDTPERVSRYSAETGSKIADFASAGGDLATPYGTTIGPDGLLYVSSLDSDRVVRFDPADNSFVDTFVAFQAGGMREPKGLSFGPDGNLYVVSSFSGEVFRYDGTTGAFIDVFVAAGTLVMPTPILFTSGGSLLVGDASNDDIEEYDATTGAPLGVFATLTPGGTPTGLTAGPGGNVFVALYGSSTIEELDGMTGASIGTFVGSGLSAPHTPVFGPDGDLWVTDYWTDEVKRFDGSTGSALGARFTETSPAGPMGLTLIPDFQVSVTAPLAVNSTGDASDTSPGDGSCDTGGLNASSQPECTLRAAIEETNALGSGSIGFSVPVADAGHASGVWTIAPATALPAADNPVVIDGSTQVGWSSDPIIAIDGSSSGNGLELSGGQSTIRGLAVHSFSGFGIELTGPGSNTIAGNRIGLLADGTTIGANSGGGIHIESTSVANHVGGSASVDRNVIAGNTGHGILVESTGNEISGNHIGTDTTGLLDRGNGGAGVAVIGENANTIDDNVISGNSGDGVRIENSDDNVVTGNMIGVGADGSTAIGNSGNGVRVYSTGSGNRFGGITPGDGNLVGHNSGDGIAIDGDGSDRNAIIGTSILNNGGLGIDLGADAVTANDSGDGDVGPNDELNVPVISGANAAGGSVTVDFDLDVPAGQYRIEAFTNPSAADPSGSGEGEAYQAGTMITHAGSGSESFQMSYAGFAGEVLTMTATEVLSGALYGSTSEFSVAAVVSGDNAIGVAVADGAGAIQAPTVIDPATNDTDGNGDTIRAIDFGAAANGTVVANGDGTATYTPSGAFSGPDAFEYLSIDSGAVLTNHWPLDGDAEDAFGSADGTLINGPAATTGNFGQALVFDGADDHVLIPDIAYASALTVAFEFKLDGNSGSLFQYIYSHGNINSTDSINIFVLEDSHGTDPNMLRTVVRDGDDSLDNFALQTPIASLVGDGNWHDYVLTADPVQGLTVYIDGIQVATDPTRGTAGIDPNGQVYVGARDDLSADRYYANPLDSLQVYGRALSADEVGDLTAEVNRNTVTLTVVSCLAADADGDGLCDSEEDANTDADNDPATNPGPNTDGDGLVNYLDPDDDDDGSPTAAEQADPNGDGDPRDAADGDHDGEPDYLDGGTTTSNGTIATDQKISNSQGALSATLDADDHFAGGVAAVGDLDGDGVVDVAVTASGDDDGGANHGAIHILLLNPDGTVKAEQKISDTTGGLTEPLDDNDNFGTAIAGIGDLDGDGVNDLAVTASGDDDGGANHGAIHILLLNPDGTVKAEQKISDTTGGFTEPLNVSDEFGTAVSWLGDVDGDGVVDLAVGSPRDSDGGPLTGAAYVLFLNPDGTVRAEQKIAESVGGLDTDLDNTDFFGAAVAGAGDLDSDGTNDLLVGAQFDDDGGDNRGAVYVLFLNADGTVKAEQKLSDTAGNLTAPLQNHGNFGRAIAGIGDLDGDKSLGIIVGATYEDDGASDAGAAYVLDLGGAALVNSSGDAGDATPGDHLCRTGGTNSDGNAECTLRAALEEANASGEVDVIRFELPVTDPGHASGVWTIGPSTMLPIVTAPVVIDGSSQSGFSAAPVIQLDGSALISTNDHGLELGIGSDASTIRSVSIVSFPGAGLWLEGSDDHQIVGNHLGIASDGATAGGNRYGMYLTASSSSTIGGTDTTDRNVISANDYSGIAIYDSIGLGLDSFDTVVIGNYVGTDSTGNLARGNGRDGVFVVNGSSRTLVGGPTAAEANVIAANGDAGVFVGSGSMEDTVVEGNLIGVSVDGSTELPNTTGVEVTWSQRTIVRGNIIGSATGHGISLAYADNGEVVGNIVGTNAAETADWTIGGSGILIDDTSEANIIGGTAGPDSNLLTNATLTGITVTPDAGSTNSVLGNRIHSNSGIGIDLNDDGPTANDAGDGDTGPNALLNTPVLTTASESAGSMTVGVDLDAPAGNYRIELFANQAADATGFGEGETFLTASTVTHTGSGVESFVVVATTGQTVLTATATEDLGAGSFGATSEFSAAFAAPEVTTVNSTGDSGDASTGDGRCDTGALNSAGDTECTLRASIEEANATPSMHTIHFDLPTTEAGYDAVNGYWTITPTTAALPMITNDVVVDATTQPGYSGTPVVALDGANRGPTDDGLGVGAGPSRISGFSVIGWPDDGMHANADDVTFTANWFGVDPTGTVDGQTSSDLVIWGGASNVAVGGPSPTDGNVFAAASTDDGLLINDATGTLVQNNRFGVDSAGTTALGAAGEGVIVGVGPTANTSIVDNQFGGMVNASIVVMASSSNTTIARNIFGTDATKSVSLPVGSALWVGDDATGVFGGTTPGDGNVVRNAWTGVYLDSGATGTLSILGNDLAGNSGLGIDLEGDGVTANDLNDADGGPNSLLNYPVITETIEAGGIITVEFSLDVPAGDYRIEAFTNPAGADPSGHGEGEAFGAARTVGHTGSGAELFSINLPGAVNDIVTLTATEDLGGASFGATSEFSAAATATAATAVRVNSTGDGSDLVPGDDICDTGGTNSQGNPECSLRAALEETNAPGGTLDEIHFAIPATDPGWDPGAGIWTITPTVALPATTDDVVIDGSTQSGFTANTNPAPQPLNGQPVIELDGSTAGAATGIRVQSSVTIRGLVITSFGEDGVLFDSGSDGSSLVASYVGTDSTGLVDRGNADAGVEVIAPGITIGGTVVADRNLISGNRVGVQAATATASALRIEANLIGLGSDGATAIGATDQGVRIDGADGAILEDNVISGNAPAAPTGGVAVLNSSGATVAGNLLGVGSDGTTPVPNGRGLVIDNAVGVDVSDNVISANTTIGIYLRDSSVTATANRVGVDAADAAAGNGGAGVMAEDADGSTVGGTIPAAANTIANNGGAGVVVLSGADITILGNSITDNGGLAVDWSDDGVTTNDSPDVDGVPNRVVISRLNAAAGSATAEFDFEAAAGDYRIEFFSVAIADPSGSGELATFRSTTTVTHTGSGPESFAHPFPAVAGDLITATVTSDQGAGSFGSTSEASATVEVNTAPTFDQDLTTLSSAESESVVQANPATDLDGDTLTWSATGLPPGLTINPSTGAVTGVVSATAEASSPYTPSITVIDGRGGVDTDNLTWTITETNQPPTLTPISDITADEQTPITFTAAATDPDLPTNTITYTATGLPPGATLNPTTGNFTWTPTETQGPNTYPITITATDNGTPPLNTNQPLTITITETNQPPTLTPIPNQTSSENATINLPITATDPDLPTNTLTYTATGLPPGLTINPTTGTITGTVGGTAASGSPYSISIGVTDGLGGNDGDVFTWTVVDTNQSPVLDPIAPITVDEGNLATFTATASDPDLPADTLTLSASGLPAGATFNPASGVFAWTPTEADGPTSVVVTITVTDDGTPNLATGQPVVITVNESNQGPTLAPLSDPSGPEGTPITFTAAATDPDLPTNTITYTATGLPPGATLNPTTGNFTWTPTETQGPNTYPITITATDNGTPPLNTNQPLTITITETNQPPTLTPIPNQTSSENATINLPITATDPDLPTNTLTYTATGLPPGLTINPTTGTITGVTTFDSGGGPPHAASVTAIDEAGASATASFAWTVTDGNRAPTIDPVIAQSVDEGAQLTIDLDATDPDGDALSYGLAGAPAGVGIDPQSGRVDWIPTEDQGPGSYTFSVVADDGDLTATTLVTVVVAERNRPPVLATPSDTTAVAGAAFKLGLVAVDPDLPANELEYHLVDGPSGMAVDPFSGVVTWTPGETTSGDVEVVVDVADDAEPPLRDETTFTISVAPSTLAFGVPPTATGDAFKGDYQQTLDLDVLANDEGDRLTLVGVSQPTGGTATVVDGRIRFVPDPGFVGLATFTYEIREVDGTISTAAVTVVVGLPDLAAADDVVTTMTGRPIDIDVLTNDELEARAASMTATQPGAGTTTVLSDRRINYTPDDDFLGDDHFRYTVTDEFGTTRSAIVTVTVNPAVLGDEATTLIDFDIPETTIPSIEPRSLSLANLSEALLAAIRALSVPPGLVLISGAWLSLVTVVLGWFSPRGSVQAVTNTSSGRRATATYLNGRGELFHFRHDADLIWSTGRRRYRRGIWYRKIETPAGPGLLEAERLTNMSDAYLAPRSGTGRSAVARRRPQLLRRITRRRR